MFSSICDMFNTINKFCDNECKTTKIVTPQETSFTTVTNGVSLTSIVDAGGNVTFKASVDLNSSDAKNKAVNILLSIAEPLVNDTNVVTVELTMDNKTHTFKSVKDDNGRITFATTNLEGVNGYMYRLNSDVYNNKEWYFTENPHTEIDSDCCGGCVCDDCEGCGCTLADDVDEYYGEPVDEKDTEMDAYANFMCNVVCGDCEKETCDGCEVVGQGDCDNEDNEDDEDNNDIIPADVDDKDYAKFIKTSKTKTCYVNYDDMMINLKNILIRGDYDYEDGYIAVMLEDLIVKGSFGDDVNVAENVLKYETKELQRFIDDASDKFGFSSGSYSVDNLFPNMIDIKFYLPE